MAHRFSLLVLLLTYSSLTWVVGQDLAPFQRTITGFQALDATGTALPFPFLGGFILPRPQFLDIDADGDLDLFVQERPNTLMFFENIGTPGQPDFQWRTDAYQGLQVGEWYRFVDADGDGDYDLFAEELFSHVRYYRNDGTPATPQFTSASRVAQTTDGENLFSDRQNLPQFVDLNCDNQLDLLLGRLDGTITHYTLAAFAATGSPQFALVANRFQDIEIITGLGKQASDRRHGANALTLHDLDRDGDVDLFWGDFFEAGLLFFENTGTCTTPAFSTVGGLFPFNDPLRTSGFNMPTFADLDSDGDDDLFIGILGGAFSTIQDLADNFHYYENTGNQTFTLRTERFLASLDVGDESAPAFGDIDSDGDLDLLVGNRIDPTTRSRAELHVFENQGNGTFQQRPPLPIDATNNYMPTLADLDGDGDDDLLVGAWDGTMTYYRNESLSGQVRFVRETRADLEADVGQNNAPAFVDIDADGDYDLFVGESSGVLNAFRNTGTPTNPSFVLTDENVAAIDVGQRSAPAFFDSDQDGDYDLFVGAQDGTVWFYRNTGTPTTPVFIHDPNVSLTTAAFATPAFADVDADGDTDLFLGSIRGGVIAYVNGSVRTSTEAPASHSAHPHIIGNYPNPFTQTTTLHYFLPHASTVILAISDLLGREVHYVASGIQPSGYHEHVLDALGWASGLYVVTLRLPDHSPQSHLILHNR